MPSLPPVTAIENNDEGTTSTPEAEDAVETSSPEAEDAVETFSPSPSTRPSFEEMFSELGEGLQSARNFASTYERIQGILPDERDDVPPAPLQPWECRIGGCKFYVPPININVQKVFKSGSMTGAAIRQPNSPKFNTGHTETVIQMTLYFPNYELIFGFEDSIFEIDFDNDSDEKIDRFLSSLRGLIAQFKYMPILPIRNQYLNQVFDITGVALKDMTITNVEGFPEALAVVLTLCKFNHKVYMPMIRDFEQAVHWGRFRQFAARAAARLAQSSRPIATFGIANSIAASQTDGIAPEPSIISVDEALAEAERQFPSISPKQSFQKHTFSEVNRFDFYFPFHSPAAIELPPLEDLRPDENTGAYYSKTAWEEFLGFLGLDVVPAAAAWEKVTNSEAGYIHNSNEYNLLVEFFRRLNLAFEFMGPSQLETYVAERIDALGIPPSAQAEFRSFMDEVWWYTLYRFLMEDPTVANAFIENQRRRRHLSIEEWELPMWKLNLDKDKVKVQKVAVSIGNVFAKLQLQMQDEPTFQHIGGQDSRVEVTLRVVGESELVKLRTMFDTITGLARLEHSHGVLGFLGVQSIITELVGIRYCVPLAFEVNTVPNFPHIYDVHISLTDFDIFQQKRETLSYAQQAELAEAFGKQNPFFRIKQLWGHINAYPDFPLEVRDEDGKIVGHLDPDFYFRHFKTIDDDLVSVPGEDSFSEVVGEARNVTINLGNYNGTPQRLESHINGVSVYDGDNAIIEHGSFNEATASNTLNQPYIDGLTPPSGYMHPHLAGNDPSLDFTFMMKDMQYRDKSGRMIRAFPTYMLWLIDEAGDVGGMKLFDNFYGLQAVIDFSIVQSEDINGDTLVIRLSNLYSRLSTRFQDYLEETNPGARIINEFTRQAHRRLTSMSDNYVLRLDTIQLKPGLRLHLRVGYGSDPNRLDTVFNGIITDVQQGEIITVTAQSDAIELNQLINTTNESGHTGKVDGHLLGLYMSEPRDLMCTLLTQGSSVVREVIANATQGKIFSENRFGIRHFGTMLYEPLDSREENNHNAAQAHMQNYIASSRGDAAASGFDTPVASVASGVWDVLDSMWASLATRRDYEIFKRNIYPGNGSGVAQYLGGDLDVIGLMRASGDTSASEGDGVVDLTNEGRLIVEAAVQDALDVPEPSSGNAGTSFVGNATLSGLLNLTVGLPGSILGAVTSSVFTFGTGSTSNLLDILGIIDKYDDDGPMDEIAFRATTYMKTVWDIFELCAHMLPDYIVAVRPFEDRSTVFYGKPHWIYTSGLIPLTTGLDVEDAPARYEPDAELQNFMNLHAQEIEKADAFQSFEDFFEGVSTYTGGSSVSSDPTAGTGGITLRGPEEIMQMPTVLRNTPLPWTEGKVGLEMHLPTSPDLQEDIRQHRQLPGLPDKWKHPFYMNREGGPNDSTDAPINPNPSPNSAVLVGDDATKGGKPGASGFLSPEVEQYYCNMQWLDVNGRVSGWRSVWGDARILIYSPETQKAVLCIAAEWGPADSVVAGGSGKVAGCSPDAFFLLGQPSGPCIYRVYPDQSASPGPVVFSSTGGQTSNESTTLPTDEESPTVEVEFGILGTTIEIPLTVPEGGFEGYPRQPGESDDAYIDRVGGHVPGIPVNPSGVLPIEGVFADPETASPGEIAASVYAPRSNKEANEVWDELRTYFHRDIETRTAFLNLPYLASLNEEQMQQVVNEAYLPSIEAFREFMWSNPYARGWVVRVANKRLNATNAALEAINPDRTLDWGIIGIPLDALEAVDGVISTAGSAIVAGIDAIAGLFGIGNDEPEIEGVDDISTAEDQLVRKWDFSAVYGAYSVYVTYGGDAAIDFMKQNFGFGRDEGGLGARIIEEMGAKLDQGIEIIKKAFNAIGAVATGLINFFRLTLHNLANGIAMGTNIQKQTSVLNRMLNDSVYYQAGREVNPDGTLGAINNPLLYYADNPFTREYGEPVVEIRQPFQRVHTIGSFQHIIANQITENGNIPTVMTAIQNEGDPVTVHFDKSAPAERQIEATVDTGLIIDHPKGWFGLQKIINPIQSLRYFSNLFGIGNGSGVSFELTAKRVALSHLKESLKDIYGGELIVLGDASIRPFDIVYLADVYSKIYGPFEVEQVVHHFSPETGFITSITPNAVVTINDPARFSLLASWRGAHNIGVVRDSLRNSLQIYADNDGGASANIDITVPSTQEYSVKELELRAEQQLNNSWQYSGGASNIIKMLAGWGGAGAIVGTLAAGASVFGGLLGAWAGWQAWGWIRDNLLDQHGCTIQFLTKDGQPMDANLVYNDGVAVGHQRVAHLVIGGINVADINLQNANGDTKIRMQDVVHALQWDEYGPNEAAQQVDLFVDATIAEVRNQLRESLVVTGLNTEAYWCRVTGIVDADTIDVETIGELRLGIGDFNSGSTSRQLGRVRLNGINAPEDPTKNFRNDNIVGAPNLPQHPMVVLNENHPGTRATQYAIDTLLGRKVAIRVDPLNRTDSTDSQRTLGYVFHNAPLEITREEEIRDWLLHTAGSLPAVPWNGFLPDGRPYTFNWELVINGMADAYRSDLEQDLPGRGVTR